MELEQLETRLKELGYDIYFIKKGKVLVIGQFLYDDLDSEGKPNHRVFGKVWIEDEKFILNGPLRYGPPDLREFTSLEPLVALILEEFPLVPKPDSPEE